MSYISLETRAEIIRVLRSVQEKDYYNGLETAAGDVLTALEYKKRGRKVGWRKRTNSVDNAS